MSMPKLIFCAGNNPHFAGIAKSHGFLYGAQLPSSIFGDVYFADQDWKNPNREIYMRWLARYRPYMASVLDFERADQRDEVLSWAEEAAQFVKVVMIIPKASGEIQSLPRQIRGAEVRLGYSVPTKHGGTTVDISEFSGWPIHLLGGSPGKQMRLSFQMDVQSADGNMMMKMANRGLFWSKGKKEFSNHWTSLKQSDGKRWDGNGTHESFRRSCVSIMDAWKELYT